MEAFSVSSCFPCLSARKKQTPPPVVPPSPPAAPQSHRHDVAAAARTFSFNELAAATRNFSDNCLVADKEARLYKGYLKSVNQVVVMKLQHLGDRDDGRTEQRNSQFLARVLMLSPLRHPNLLGLIGFCADGNHRILVHQHMPLGSLEDHLHDPSPDKAQLDWRTRMNVAAGVARGLEYLHQKGIAYRVITSSDILLGDGHRPMLSQYGLAELSQLLIIDDADHEARAIPKSYFGTLAPETAMIGKSSSASNVFSFGVVLLELITERRAANDTRTRDNVDNGILLTWAQPLLNKREFRQMADPALQGRYPPMGLEEALTVASMCIQQHPTMRSPISAVVTALSRLADDRSN